MTTPDDRKTSAGQPADKSERLDDAGPVPDLDSVRRQPPTPDDRHRLSDEEAMCRHCGEPILRRQSVTGWIHGHNKNRCQMEPYGTTAEPDLLTPVESQGLIDAAENWNGLGPWPWPTLAVASQIKADAFEAGRRSCCGLSQD